MPFTPFHFGPGAALHSAAPKRISFLAFCSANVLIDVEPLYYLLSDQYPVHRFFHTYIGATLVGIGAFVLFAVARAAAARIRLPNPFRWQQLRLQAVAVGAGLGVYSHVFLDSFMHPDIKPLAPFSDANPLWKAIPVDVLYWFCVTAGAIGLVVIVLRRGATGADDVHHH
ncbi:metal-dependent hydrolase [Herbaspirillum sp. ST 5-3]|uniref:metal-dependent hydrolase n=1 Tax=Oxalobacteraceae TaxID=75682 RepID=UPI0010A45584|nr:metal-dependent hydrolase [Herbaspirillum sp. ST 5-3]